MRKKGNILEFAQERRDEIVAAIRAEGACADRFDLLLACRRAVARQASRFWVSEERAARVVSALSKGCGAIEGMDGAKRRMYEEIWRRVEALRPGREGEPLVSLVREVVYEPAPEHYVSAVTAMNMYYGHLRSNKAMRSNG